MIRAFSKVYAFQNSKLIQSSTLNYNHYTKAWMRLTYLMNSEENQGFLVQFLALNILIYYTWRFHWDASWKLNHRKTQNCLNCPNFKIRVYSFGLWGWASFWVDWSLCLFCLRKTTHHLHLIHCVKLTTPVCASQSLQNERVVNCH